MVREEDMEAERIVDQVEWHRVVKNFPPSYDVPQLYFIFHKKCLNVKSFGVVQGLTLE